MTFEEYQKKSRTTALYPNVGKNYVYPTLGLAGEAGEVAEKIKKVIRDYDGEVSPAAREEIKKELGDVLWYAAQIASELGFSLEEAAASNIAKLEDRQARGALHGNGDNR